MILAALEYGIFSSDVRHGELIHHSDRGRPVESGHRAYVFVAHVV